MYTFVEGGVTVWDIKDVKGTWYVKNYLGNGPFEILAALSMSFLVIKLCFFISNKKYMKYASNLLKWFGKNSIIVLAFHIIELDLFPWPLFIENLAVYVSGTYILPCIIAMKLLWAALGIIIINNIKFLRRIYT